MPPTMPGPVQENRFLGRSAPPEIIINILQSCDSTRDVLSLVLTCRHISQVWRSKTAAALWPVFLRKIPHVKEALIAVSCVSAAPQS